MAGLTMPIRAIICANFFNFTRLSLGSAATVFWDLVLSSNVFALRYFDFEGTRTYLRVPMKNPEQSITTGNV
jgi:uncharacterized membrane protein